MKTVPKPSGRPAPKWLQFSLRGMLLSTLVGAVALGWYTERTWKQRQAVAWVLNAGGTVSYDCPQMDCPFGTGEYELSWIQKQVGIDFFYNVVSVSLKGEKVTTLTPLATLRGVEELHLFDLPVSDLSPLSGMKQMETLILTGPSVSDLSPLAGLLELKVLVLNNTSVSDVSPLAKMSRMERLGLHGTMVSDVTPLQGMSRLDFLDVSDTKVSDVSALAHLPNLVFVIGESQHLEGASELQERNRRDP